MNRRAPVIWNVRRDAILLEMAERGEPAGDIGSVLGAPAETVALRLCVLRVRATPPIYEDEPAADDVDGESYWRARCAALSAQRETPDALRARIAEDEAIIARAEARGVPSDSLAGMCVEIARDRRDRAIIRLAEVETAALLARIASGDGRSR